MEKTIVLAVILLQVATIITEGNLTGKKGGLTLLKNGKTLNLPLTRDGSDNNYGIVGVGKDNIQTFNVVFDTSANVTWFLTKDVANRISGKFKFFEVGQASSFKKGSNTFSGAYVNGEVTGYTGTDTLTINTDPEAVVLANFEIGLATKFPEDKRTLLYNYDGEFGLNLVSEELMEGKGETFLYKLSKELDKVPSFGFYLNKLKTEPKYLVFGEPDARKLEGGWTSHDVQKVNGFYNGWNVKLTSFVVKGITPTTIPVPAGKYAQFVSVSTALLVGPTQLINKLNDAIFTTIKGIVTLKNKNAFSCGQSQFAAALAKLPNVQLVIDNEELNFYPIHYIGVNENGDYQSIFVGADIDYFVLGWSFMSTYYTKFDYQNKKVHFSKYAYNLDKNLKL